MNTAIDSYKLVVVVYQICGPINDDTDYIALYMLAAPDSVIFINEFESVQNHRNSLDVHHKKSL